MASEKLTARKLRKEIGSLGFEYGVSLYKRGGVFWISPLIGVSISQRETIRARLIALGYHPFCDGQPGTAGQYSVSIKADDAPDPEGEAEAEQAIADEDRQREIDDNGQFGVGT